MFAVESLLFQHQGLKVAKKAGWHNSSFVGLLQNYVYCSGTFGPTRIFQILGFLMQTWNLSKNLHRRIFRLKFFHRQFHLISTVLVGKKWVKMEKFTPLAKILHCHRHWRHGQIPPLQANKELFFFYTPIAKLPFHNQIVTFCERG